jgi:CHAT domain
MERAWREGQAGIDDGSPKALRAAAAQLEGLAEDPEVSALARAHILYDAGVALSRLLGIDADAPVRALACETRAARMLKDRFVGGEESAADGWLDALSALTQVCARAADTLGVEPLRSAGLEVDVARELFRGTSRWARIGVCYSNIGIGLLRVYRQQVEGQRDRGIRDQAVNALDTAVEMLESGPEAAAEFEHELFVARVNGCTCAALDVAREAEVTRLTERCLETYEWLASHGRGDNAGAGMGVSASCAVLHSMQRALAAFLIQGMGERRLEVARTAAARLLLLAHPELWLPMSEPHPDPCPAVGEMTPIEALLGVEVAYLEDFLEEATESAKIAAAVRVLWPAAVPMAVFNALDRLGRNEPWVQQLVLSLLDRAERSSAGTLTLAEQLEERFGEFLFRWCREEEAPIEEMKSLRAALMSDPESSAEDRLRRVSLIVGAAADSPWRWRQGEVEAILELVRAWAPSTEEREHGFAWPRSKIRLLGRLTDSRPDLLENLREEARGARAMLVSSGPPDAEAVDLYEDASVAEAFALREIGHRDGDDDSLASATALPMLLVGELERWGVAPGNAQRLIAAVSAEVEIEQRTYEDVTRKFRSAITGEFHNDCAQARRLLTLIVQRREELDEDTAAAAREAMRLLLDDVRSGAAAASTLSLFPALADHPQLPLNLEDAIDLAERGLLLAEEGAMDDLALLLRLSLLAERYEDSAEDRLLRLRVSERIARLVFSSRRNLEQIDATLCGFFLAQQALDAEPARGATFTDRRSRLAVAVAALIAAHAGGRAATIALSLWSAAGHARLYDAGAADALYAALRKYMAGFSPAEIPESLRRAIRADIAMFASGGDEEEAGESTAGPWDRQSGLIWRASRFYAVRPDSELDDGELWRDISRFLTDIEASGAADEDRAAWILGAAQAASISSRRREIDEAVARRLAEAALRAGRSPRAPQTALGLPLFELTILLAVLIGDDDLARSALGSYRAAVNQRILMSPDFATALDGVQTLGAIDRAATEALDRGLGIGLEIAESGRTKLLTAMGAGLLPVLSKPLPGRTTAFSVDGLGEVLERLVDGSLTDPLGLIAELLDDDVSWVDAVADLVVPWRSVPHVEELDRLSEAGDLKEVAGLRGLALADPSPGELRNLSGSGRILAWALGSLEDPRVAMLVDGALLLGDSEEPVDFADLDPDSLLGPLPSATRRAFNLRAQNQDRLPDRARIVVVDCGADPKLAVEVANGLSLASRKAEPDIPPIAPSARLLRPAPVSRGKAPVEATVLANPTGDLPGSLIEAAAWSARGDLEPLLVMQADATVKAFLDALCRSRLVVLSAHGRVDPRAGAALRLADGEVSIEQLLHLGDAIVAERMILSCCWGGSRSTWISQREALGVVNCLLALGVKEVLAPVEVVPDLATGIFGAGLARSYVPEAGVGNALLGARLELTRISPGAGADELVRVVRDEVASGAVMVADPAQVERAVNGVRETAPLELVRAGQSFGVFSVDSAAI